MVIVKSKQINLKINHVGEPTFNLEFDEKNQEIEISKEIAEFLETNHKDMFTFKNKESIKKKKTNEVK